MDFGCHVLIQSDEDFPNRSGKSMTRRLVLYVKGALTREGQKRGGDGRLAHDDALRHRNRAQAGLSTGLRGCDGRFSGGARGIDTGVGQSGRAVGERADRRLRARGAGINIVFPPEKRA